MCCSINPDKAHSGWATAVVDQMSRVHGGFAFAVDRGDLNHWGRGARPAPLAAAEGMRDVQLDSSLNAIAAAHGVEIAPLNGAWGYDVPHVFGGKVQF